MNAFSGIRIEFHILQSFPVSCLNRDDVGAPKSALIGGVPRARVSSQCWKRHIRLAMHDLGVKLAVRTKSVAAMLEKACIENGAEEKQAADFAAALAPLLSDDTLLFFSEAEAKAFAAFAAKSGYSAEAAVKKQKLTPEFKKIHKEYFNPAADGLDIALFGRMVAQVPEMNVFAAASVAHAISTHEVSNEIEFFTAMDDLKDEPGSAHMGSLEFNAATYYRYVSLDLGQLCDTLCGQGMAEAVEAFTKALYIAVPSARQTTQAAMRPWDYARVCIRKGQGMQVSFDKPVNAKEGYLEESIGRLNNALDTQARLAGSLYGGLEDFTYGDGGMNIDELAGALVSFVRTREAG